MPPYTLHERTPTQALGQLLDGQSTRWILLLDLLFPNSCQLHRLPAERDKLRKAESQRYATEGEPEPLRRQDTLATTMMMITISADMDSADVLDRALMSLRRHSGRIISTAVQIIVNSLLTQIVPPIPH